MRRGSVRIGIHRHLTIRSSRPHVVASAVCFTLRLHTSVAPPRGGLTQALGGRKALCSFVLRSSGSSASVGIALRTSSRPVALSVKYVQRAHTLHALRLLASETAVNFRMAFPLQMRSLRRPRRKVCQARSSVLASTFGNGAWVSFSPGSFAPNKSFKPTPCRGASRVLCATLARVRRPATGRLNSGVRRLRPAVGNS